MNNELPENYLKCLEARSMYRPDQRETPGLKFIEKFEIRCQELIINPECNQLI